MEEEVLRIKRQIRAKRAHISLEEKPTVRDHSFWFYFGTKLCLTILLTLIALIVLKSNSSLKAKFYHHVYETNFSFATVNQLYQQYFGSPLPFKDLLGLNTKPVFDEKLKYHDTALYKDGVALTVDTQYLVPVQSGGLVIFIGEKEDYGQVVIIQQSDGVELWYGNMKTVSVNLYDYVDAGALLGEVKDTTLYLVYKKDGKVLDYHDFI